VEKLRLAFPCGEVFSRRDVMAVLDLKPSRASELLKVLREMGVIAPVTGCGKGKYRFTQRGE